VAKDANEREIKAAYGKLARKHHPDVNPGNPHQTWRTSSYWKYPFTSMTTCAVPLGCFTWTISAPSVPRDTTALFARV
jgi:hypothetical protein